jgi:hypothetical protein
MKKAFQQEGSRPPAGRLVLLVARVWLKDATAAAEVGVVPPLDPGARGKDGKYIEGLRFHKPSASDPNLIEIAAWNTGEDSRLRKLGSRTHAETQLYEFLNATNKRRLFKSIELEITHSPCTHCCGLLRSLKEANPGSSASLRWIEPYDSGEQATNKTYLETLLNFGWELAAPSNGLPLCPGIAGRRWRHDEIGSPGKRIKNLDVMR